MSDLWPQGVGPDEEAILDALRDTRCAGEMVLHYQPIHDLLRDEICGVEALARWESLRYGSISPEDFIPIAERNGIIGRLTLSLLGKALQDLQRIPAPLGLSFNLSAHDLASPAMVDAVMNAVTQSGCDPRRLTFELTETALMADFERANEGIARFREQGIKLALDDFGSGYSSLGYVHRLHIDRVKIDRSFIVNLDSPSAESVFGMVLGLCENLRIEAVAEGVEDERQLGFVRRQGCRFAQGFLLGRPMPLADLLGVLAAGQAQLPERLSA